MLWWGRKQTSDYLKPEELQRTHSVEVSGFTKSHAHADSRYPMWQRQHLERQPPVVTSQVYSRNPWQALFSTILIYIPTK